MALLLSDASPVVINSGGGSACRYLLISRTGPTGNASDAYLINLAQIEMYDASGTNVASGATATMSSQHSADYPATNLLDGKYDTFGHTADGDTNPWVRVDLGSLKTIYAIRVVNRQDCCGFRAVGLTVSLLGGSGDAVASTIFKSAPSS